MRYKDYKEYDDSELYLLVCEENEDAKDILFEKYKYIIDIIIRKYITKAKTVGIEYNDLYQEALVGLSEAIVNYREDKASLQTFITLCVERRLQKVVIKNSRPKHMILFEALSLDYSYDEYSAELKDMLSDNGKSDPLNSVTNDEDLSELERKIEARLSASEYDVYSLLINGFNYIEIAEILNKNPKQVDNAIQRIRSKIKQIIDIK